MVVPLLRERRAESLAEEREALLGHAEQLARVPLEVAAQRLAAEQAEAVVAALLADLVERAGVDDDDVRREARGVREGPLAATVLAVGDAVRSRVAGDRPRCGGADGEAVRRLEVRLVEAGPRPPGAVRLEGAPDIDQLVRGVDGAQDPRTACGVPLDRVHDQHVLLGQVWERDPALGRGVQVQVEPVEGDPLDLRGAVDERRGALLVAAEGDRGGGDPVGPVEHPAQVDLDVVAVDLEDPGALASLVQGQAARGESATTER